MNDLLQHQSKAKGQFKQEKSAVVIQKYARRHLAKNQLQKKKKEKEEYEELMEKLQKEVRQGRFIVYTVGPVPGFFLLFLFSQRAKASDFDTKGGEGR